MAVATPSRSRTIQLSAPLELGLTLAPLWRGRGDPTMRIAGDGVWRVTRTPEGPATVYVCRRRGGLEVIAWGPGADYALETAPRTIGLEDDPAALRTNHRLVRELARRHPGLRLPRTMAVVEALIPAIVEQKVTGRDAHRAFRGLVATHGERAPGPAGDAGMRVPPDPAVLRALPYFAYHPFGLEERRSNVIRRVAAEAARLEAASALPPSERERRLRAIPGVGPWTAAEVAARAWGDPDAVSVGDYHLPDIVAWAFTGERRGTDDRMLELLEPFRGQRGRVIRLLEVSGIGPPRRGPRLGSQPIAGI